MLLFLFLWSYFWFSSYRYTVTTVNKDGPPDRIVKPQRDKDGVLIKQNMRVLKLLINCYLSE
jgi:hypothetical protein